MKKEIKGLLITIGLFGVYGGLSYLFYLIFNNWAAALYLPFFSMTLFVLVYIGVMAILDPIAPTDDGIDC